MAPLGTVKSVRSIQNGRDRGRCRGLYRYEGAKVSHIRAHQRYFEPCFGASERANLPSGSFLGFFWSNCARFWSKTGRKWAGNGLFLSVKRTVGTTKKTTEWHG